MDIRLALNPGPVPSELVAAVEDAKSRAHSSFPNGRVQRFSTEGGYLSRDGIPFFYLHWHSWLPLTDPHVQQTAEVLSYYTLFNTYHSAGAGVQAAQVPPGQIPNEFLDEAGAAYEIGCLITPRGGSEAVTMPGDMASEQPELVARNHRDQPYRHRWGGVETFEPGVGSLWRLSQVRDRHASLALWSKDHPSVLGPFVWEEMYYPRGGFAQAEMDLYHEWLRDKYHSIEELNAEWATNYSSFAQIVPPTAECENEEKPLYGLRHGPDVYVLAKTEEKLDVSANGLNFQLFKLEDISRRQALIYQTYKALDPDHPVIGSKGPRGPQMWTRHQYVDISGEAEILGPLVQPGIEASERVWQPATVNLCPYWKYPSAGWPHYPFYRGPWQRYNSWPEDLYSIQSAPYAKILREIFNGAKSLFVEDYTPDTGTEGGCEYHYIHLRKHFDRLRQKGQLTAWGNQEVEYAPEERDLPPVVVEEKTLQMARAYQAAYRLAPIFLPTKRLAAQVGILTTLQARFAPAGKWIFWEVVPALVDALERVHVPSEVITDYNLDDIRPERYRLLVVAWPAHLISSELAGRLRAFVEAGGKILYIPGGAGRSAQTLEESPSQPGLNLSDLFGVTWDAEVNVADNYIQVASDALPGLDSVLQLPCFSQPPQYSKGQIPWIGALPPARNENAGALRPLSGSRTLGTIGSAPAVIMNQDNTVLSAVVPQLQVLDQVAHPWEQNWRAFFNGLLSWAGVARPVQVHSATQPELVDPGVLVGDGYWLLGTTNYSAEEQKTVLRLEFLPEGAYDVTDVTGERPIIQQHTNGQNHLQPDSYGRQARFVVKDAHSTQLAGEGLEVKLPAKGGLILLIRPAAEKVWVDMPVAAVQQQAARTGYVITGNQPSLEEKAVAARLTAKLKSLGIQVRQISAEEMSSRDEKFEVVVDGQLLETFETRPLEAGEDLILVGNARTNEAIAHIENNGTYAYDKVLEKVSPSYPGPGRGIIQLVEAVNSPAYDATGKCRRALLVGGSDPTGTVAAVDKLEQIVG